LIDKNIAQRIKAIVTDVDGVLTDGTFWWDANDLELKRFCFADITGIPLAQKAGIRIALMSGESSASGMAIVERYAKKLHIEDVYKGCHDKTKAVMEFSEKHRIALSDICFVGDDINDLPPMKKVGLSVAPPDSHRSVLKSANFITASAGGHGVIREVVDLLLEIKSKHRKTAK
jgi:3-deoxy-D-manno-octulosonate 8-phosphate phosphatase (KDO 8-P phosphatase)